MPVSWFIMISSSSVEQADCRDSKSMIGRACLSSTGLFVKKEGFSGDTNYNYKDQDH